MGKTLRRYLLVEVLKAFLMGLAVFTFILLVHRMLELMDLVLSRGVPALQVLFLFGCTVPAFLELTIPMAFLLAVVVAFGRLSHDGELTALRASGISLYQMVPPVLLLATTFAAVAFGLAAEGRPWANRELEQTLYEIAKERATAALTPKVFNTDFGGIVIYVDNIDTKDGLLQGVMLSDERDSYRRTTSFAAGGRLLTDEQARSLHLVLLNGTSLSFHAGQESYDKTDFGSLEVTLDFERDLTDPHPIATQPSDMRWNELWDARSDLLAQGKPAVEESIELNGRLVLPAATILLAIIGIPLGTQKARSVHAHGFAVTIAVVLIYYVMLSASVTIARNSYVRPEVVIWAPDTVLAVVGLWMTVRAAKERWLYPPLLSWLGGRGMGRKGR